MSLLQNQKAKLIFTLLLAFAIRLVGISSRPIWYDEAFSILISEQGLSAILQGTLAADSDSSAAEEHPPAYYFMAWGWMQAFGNSLIATRMLSVIISVGIIVCIHLIANHLFDPSTALAAAFISAILPFQIHYGQEIRMYGLLTFWLCLATLAFLKRQWIPFSITAALAQYTHNLAAFYLIPLAVTPIFQRDWKTLRGLILAGIAAIILYAPWLTQIPAQLSKVTGSFWVEKPGFEKLFTLLLVYLPNLPLPNKLLPSALLLATFTITLAAYQTYRAAKNKYGEAYHGLWLAYLSFAPPLLLWLVSQISPMYVERALLPSHAIFCIWLAWAFTKTRLPRPILFTAFALIFLSSSMGLYQHITYKSFPYGAFEQINEHIKNSFRPGDVIIHSNKLTYLPSFYFDRELSQGYIIDSPGSASDTLSPATGQILDLTNYENMESASINAT
ncbi:MAG: glycosyltransferase family 39 protein [Anaerolineales bacterium]|nr:glycosyltransferase family 39 protein [Anaerolineales bacterium]